MIQTQSSSSGEQSAYIWGRGQSEIERLIETGRFLGDLTEHLLQMAGIEPGMRVLDIGSGAGDVSFLASRLVGRSGAVTGVDISAEATAAAQDRAHQAGVSNVQFITEDARHVSLDAAVDVIIGRLVLIYFDDSADLLRHLLRNLRPGGIVAFQEWATPLAASEPHCELFQTTIDRLVATFTRAGLGTRNGRKMHRIFQDAGLPPPRMHEEARVEGGADSPIYGFIEQMVRSLLPAMELTGVATAEEVGIDTLTTRLRDEALANDAVLVLPPLVGAWTRKPSA
jgi:SAM-dependent methyltransferase